jgi:hypothetical protein
MNKSICKNVDKTLAAPRGAENFIQKRRDGSGALNKFSLKVSLEHNSATNSEIFRKFCIYSLHVI